MQYSHSWEPFGLAASPWPHSRRFPVDLSRASHAYSFAMELVYLQIVKLEILSTPSMKIDQVKALSTAFFPGRFPFITILVAAVSNHLRLWDGQAINKARASYL